jgi:hypothetical protein
LSSHTLVFRIIYLFSSRHKWDPEKDQTWENYTPLYMLQALDKPWRGSFPDLFNQRASHLFFRGRIGSRTSNEKKKKKKKTYKV